MQRDYYVPPRRPIGEPPDITEQLYLEVKYLTCTLWDALKAATEITVGTELIFTDLDAEKVRNRLNTVETIMHDVISKVRYSIKKFEPYCN